MVYMRKRAILDLPKLHAVSEDGSKGQRMIVAYSPIGLLLRAKKLLYRE